MATNLTEQEQIKELGFGRAGAGELRLLNKDGSFNVVRRGLSYTETRSIYSSLITMSWRNYFLLVVGYYLITNIIFSLLFILCGPEALSIPENYPMSHYLAAFFFSVQTLATIGYGHISPIGIWPNILVTLEALIGLMGFSLATGFLFARIARPRAKLLFSANAIVAPYRGGTGLMFRLANARTSQLFEVEARVIFSRLEGEGANKKRKFNALELEYNKVTFLSLSWTVVHPIVEGSPLWGVTEEEMISSDAEILVLISGIDEIFSQNVYARSSYTAEEVVWDAKFVNIFDPKNSGEPEAIDISRLSEIEKVAAAR